LAASHQLTLFAVSILKTALNFSARLVDAEVKGATNETWTKRWPFRGEAAISVSARKGNALESTTHL
jgi:hypothetical protein